MVATLKDFALTPWPVVGGFLGAAVGNTLKHQIDTWNTGKPFNGPDFAYDTVTGGVMSMFPEGAPALKAPVTRAMERFAAEIEKGERGALGTALADDFKRAYEEDEMNSAERELELGKLRREGQVSMTIPKPPQP